MTTALFLSIEGAFTLSADSKTNKCSTDKDFQ